MAFKVLFSILFSTLTQAAIYDCTQLTPQSSGFFQRRVVLECDLDQEAKPKLLILSGSTRVPLKTKAQYVGPESAKEYERLRIVSNDGVTLDMSVATKMFVETSRGALISYEPDSKSHFWNCQIRLDN
ncbi:MAG: hypothetical protein ACK5Y2_01535 [Bdellovibrionales bacterium]